MAAGPGRTFARRIAGAPRRGARRSQKCSLPPPLAGVRARSHFSGAAWRISRHPPPARARGAPGHSTAIATRLARGRLSLLRPRVTPIHDGGGPDICGAGRTEGRAATVSERSEDERAPESSERPARWAGPSGPAQHMSDQDPPLPSWTRGRSDTHGVPHPSESARAGWVEAQAAQRGSCSLTA